MACDDVLNEEKPVHDGTPKDREVIEFMTKHDYLASAGSLPNTLRNDCFAMGVRLRLRI